MAMKISPKLPNTVENAYWVSAVPFFPLLIAPVVRTEKTVRFRMIKVSMKTLIIAVRPC